MTSEWPWTLNCHKYLNTYPPRTKFSSVALYDKPFARYKVLKKSDMHRMTSDWPWTLNCRNTLNTLKTYSRGLHFHPFCCRGSHFRLQCCGKWEMQWMTLEWPIICVENWHNKHLKLINKKSMDLAICSTIAVGITIKTNVHTNALS